MKGKCTRFWRESPKERDHSKDRGVDGRMGVERNLWKLVGGMWNGSSWLRIGACGGSCKYSNETSDSGARKLVISLVPADNGWYAIVGSLLYNAFQ
jgi:hypothetical protein